MSFREETGIRPYVHPVIINIAWARFEDGHYNDAIESAFEIIAHRVLCIAKARGLKNDSSGVKLMTDTFSPAKPLIKLTAPSDFTDQSKKDLQQGFMYLFAGSMAAIRNVAAHNKQYAGEKSDAIRKLLFASMLMYELDKVDSSASFHSTRYCADKCLNELDSLAVGSASALHERLKGDIHSSLSPNDFEWPLAHQRQISHEERKKIEKRKKEIAAEITAPLNQDAEE